MAKRLPTAAKTRHVVEQTIQRLLDAAELLMRELDTYDGDPDMEAPLGSVALMPSSDQRRWAQGNTDEREDVSEDEGGACEDEGAQDEREPDPSDAELLYHPEDQRMVVTGGFGDQVIYAETRVT